MKTVRNAVLKESKRIPVAMLIISVVMLLLSVCNICLDFGSGFPVLTISSMNVWAIAISVIPVTWGACSLMLMRTKKVLFSKMPSYIICGMVLMAMIILFIAAGEKYFAYKILGFAVAILIVYPFVIATLTIEGRMYNRVFATIFSSILLVVSVAGAVAACVILKSVMISTLIPALIYIELILNVFCYNLEKPNKNNNKSESLITH